MSSDSDDDSFSKIAKKLQSMKRNYIENKPRNSLDNNINTTATNKLGAGEREFPTLQSLNESNTDIDSTVELTLDSIIEQNTTKRKTRTRKKNNAGSNLYVPEVPVRRGRTRSSKRISAQKDERLTAHLASVVSRARAATAGNSSNWTGDEGTPSRRRGGSARGRGRSRGSQRRQRRVASDNNHYRSDVYDYYSIGNTDEYEDLSEQQEIFSAQPSDVIIIDDSSIHLPDDSLDENEELSVKVHWMSCEIIKFTIRRFQKFTQIYDYFASKENVIKEKLLFTYNDTILNVDDTPETINYNIGKFIEGGIVNQSLSPLKKKAKYEVKKGIKLKFQCQDVKKPYETVIDENEKLLVAFMKCAEHLEKPLDKLKFHFDGDLLTGKSTAKDLDLEGGECIDVVIVS